MVTLYDQFVLPITALPPHWFDRCDASADFAEHSHNWLRQLPWNLPGNLTVSRQFADYWLAEADGASPDYDATTGDWIDAVGGNEKAPPVKPVGRQGFGSIPTKRKLHEEKLHEDQCG
jgi:hypothetical protein